MGILDALFGGLFGDDEEEVQETVVEHPCSNCPSSCSIAPAACTVCQPYKEQMIDAIYWVEHKDELVSKYEVTGTTVSQGAITCPHCGGHSEDPYVCEYCGSRLQEGSGKIKVASAADIPNPVLEAQNIIFARYEAVKDYAGADEAYGLVDALSGVGSRGLLSSIFDALMGDNSENDSRSIGNKMTESEIKEMAEYYKVTVAEYLSGLDNGKYLTLSNKKTAAAAEEQYTQTTTSSSSGSSMSDLLGLGGAIGLGSLLFGGSSYNYSAARPQQPKPGTQYYHTSGNTRPPQYTGQGYPEPTQKPQYGYYPGQNTGQGGYSYIGKPTGRPPMPTSPTHNTIFQTTHSVKPAKPAATQSQKPAATQSVKPARKPDQMQNARKPAENSVSKQQKKEDSIRDAMKTVAANQAKAQKKTPQTGQSAKKR